MAHNESIVWMRRRPGFSIRRQLNVSFRASTARASFQVKCSCAVSGIGSEAF